MTIISTILQPWAVDPSINLIKRYSDKNVYIRKINTDEIYTDAIDLETSSYTYEETDIVIPDEPTEAQQ